MNFCVQANLNFILFHFIFFFLLLRFPRQQTLMICRLVREAGLTSLADSNKPVPKSLATTLPCPVLWTHGTDDKVCSYAVSKKLFDRLDACDSNAESKIFKSYEGCYHQLHTEPGGMKEQYAQDVGDWVLKIIEEPQRNGVEEGYDKQENKSITPDLVVNKKKLKGSLKYAREPLKIKRRDHFTP